MLQKIFRSKLEKVPIGVELSHPLHVGLNKSLVPILAQENTQLDENGFVGALLREYPILYDSIECYFVQIQIVETPLNVDEKEIHIFVSEEFLNHYGFKYGETCYIKSVVCHTLEKVVLGAKTTGSYSWFKDFKDLKRHNDLVVACCDKRFLCRQSDVLLVDPSKHSSKIFSHKDYITLDCQPFHQGLITLNSSLIVADLRDTSGYEKNGKTSEKNSDTLLLGKFALSLINYTSNNFLGLRLPATNASPSYGPSLNALKFICSFEIRVISKLNTHFDKELIKVKKDIDPLNTVFVSSVIAKKLCLTNGSWVKISILEPLKVKPKSPMEPLPSENKDSTDLKIPNLIRMAQVCCFSDEASSNYFPNDKIVYISPHLWFNLNRHPSLLMQPHLRMRIEPLEVGTVPPIATEAHATLIQSPNYDGKVNSQLLLSKYFDIQVICKGDILSTNSKDQFDFHVKVQDEDHDKLKWPVVYFRITNIEGPPSPYGYLLCNLTSRLYQVGTKQNYAPQTMEAYYSSVPIHPIWDSVPEGLNCYITHLQDLISPFLKLQNEKCHLSCNILFFGPPCCGKTTVVKAVCRSLNLHLFQVNCHDLVGEISSVVEARLKNKVDKGLTYAPCVILLKNIHLIGKEREPMSEDSRVIHSLANHLKNVNNYGSAWPVVVIGTATEKKLNSSLVSSFLHTVQMKGQAPTEEERSLLLQDFLTVCDVGNDVSTRYLAQRTAGFVLGDLCALVNQAVRNAYSRIRKFVNKHGLNLKEEEDLILASIPIVQKDLINALEKLQSKFAEAIGAPKIPNVKFEDIGGLAHVKQEILDTIQLPLEHPEILFSGLRRSGVLLYGPPGSGKTMLAKAVATECSLNFLSVKGPELINMYVGQSEENVRAVFHQARSAVPCIIFFDELDSLAPNRGRSGDSGGVMDRVVSQLLSELDGLNKKSEVFVIGATNRPDLIDPALLRPGRFDRLLYVGIPEDKKSKLNILKALTRKIPLSKDVNLEEIIDSCPSHLSGADFYSLCSNAVIQRVEKNVEMLEEGEKTMEELSNNVETEDFLNAMKTLVPSVSPAQFEQYKYIKSKIENN
ncbi:peroxisome assembly factor 2 [Caerostris extrusa]|uniref:Peroxisomal ATPase PEX6 n=1 Tax=Caerostris extrusa TaxID=172846 RepID=A0AAV4NN50_CAEEX|nr:peroxisome assembly factor 2 [Caerostris extrusa]